MKKFSIDNIKSDSSITPPLTLTGAIKEAQRCLLCEDPPCSKGCPAGTDPGKFIRQIRFENYKGAARTIRKNNILSTVCSYLCPVENLCEKSCSVSALENPIDISGLQRFAANYGKDNNLEKFIPSKKDSGKVAVIGGGPAGLSCAYELLKMDYDVTIFEKTDKLGGVIQWYIPHYRVPEDGLNYDISNLKDLGVEIKYNEDISSLNKMYDIANNFDSVFISTGLDKPYQVDLFKDSRNVYPWDKFLKDLKWDNQLNIEGKTVAIVGGGSVAMDCANISALKKAERVYIIYRRGLDEMPADNVEIDLGHFFNIIFKPYTIITDKISKNGKVTQIKGTEITWDKGFRSKNYKVREGSEFNLPIDYLVEAIGTDFDLEIKKMIKNPIEGIFFGGDIINSEKTVVEAVSDGKKGAKNIDLYLKGVKNG